MYIILIFYAFRFACRKNQKKKTHAVLGVSQSGLEHFLRSNILMRATKDSLTSDFDLKLSHVAPNLQRRT